MRLASLVIVFLAILPACPAVADGAPELTTAEGIRKALVDREAGTRLLAARAASEVQDKKLTSPLVKALKDDVREVREAAIESLRLREGKERAPAARGLAARLPRYLREGSSAEEHALVIQALHDLAQPSTIKALLDVPVTFDRTLIKARAMAVANVPDAEAIESLIQFGSRGRRGAGFRDITRDALNYATGQRFRTNPDEWRRWWREAKKHFDFPAAFAAREEARAAKADKERRREERRKRQREREARPPEAEPDDAMGPGITEPI